MDWTSATYVIRESLTKQIIPPILALVIEYFVNREMVDVFDIHSGHWRRLRQSQFDHCGSDALSIVDQLCSHAPHQWNVGETVMIRVCNASQTNAHKRLGKKKVSARADDAAEWRVGIILQCRLKDDFDLESMQFLTSVNRHWIGAHDNGIRPLAYSNMLLSASSSQFPPSKVDSAYTNVWQQTVARLEAQSAAMRERFARAGVDMSASKLRRKGKHKKCNFGLHFCPQIAE